MEDKKVKLSLLERLTGRVRKDKVDIDKPTVTNESTDIVVAGTRYTKKSLLNIDISQLDEKGLYELYNQMDNDAVISAALDLHADSATLENDRTGHVVAIDSPDINFKDEINAFLWDIVKIDIEAWEYIRSVAKYGKIFIDTKASNDGREWSFIEHQNPYNIKALTYGQDEVKYYAILPEDYSDGPAFGENPFLYKYNKEAGNQEIGYTVEGADRFISAFNSRKHLGKMVVETTLGSNPDDTVTEELFIRTGKSLLAPVATTWQILTLLEDQMLTYRLAKSNVFKLVQVDVTGANNKDAKRIMDSVENMFRSSESLDLTENRYLNRQAGIPTNDYVFIPVKGAKGSLTVEEIGRGDISVDLADINYFNNKLHAGLGVLKAYLGQEETTPGGLGDTTLTKLDERASKRAKRLQLILKHIVDGLISYYWRYSKKGRTSTNLPEYKIILGEVSSAEADEARSTMTTNIAIAKDIMAITDDERFKDKISNDKLFKYVFDNILNIDIKNIDNTIDPEDIQVKYNTIREDFLKNYLNRKRKLAEHKTKAADNITDDLIFDDDLEHLLTENVIYLEDEQGKVRSLKEALNLNSFKNILNEETYKQLKDLTRQQDPLRVAKSKKIQVKYVGLDDDLFINFQVTAEDPAKNAKEGRPTSYRTLLQLKDLAKVIKQAKSGDTDASLVQAAMKGDVAVACECPASKYWGQQYVGTQRGYSIVKNDIAPTRNLPTQVVCKHVLTMLNVAPFWWNTIVRDLRNKGVLGLKGKEERGGNIPPQTKPVPKKVEIPQEMPKKRGIPAEIAKQDNNAIPQEMPKKRATTFEEPTKTPANAEVPQGIDGPIAGPTTAQQLQPEAEPARTNEIPNIPDIEDVTRRATPTPKKELTPEEKQRQEELEELKQAEKDN